MYCVAIYQSSRSGNNRFLLKDQPITFFESKARADQHCRIMNETRVVDITHERAADLIRYNERVFAAVTQLHEER